MSVAAVQVVMDKTTVVACLDGDLDLASTEAVRQQLLTCAPEATCRALVVDMRPVAFVDSQGLNMLVLLRRELEGRGQQLFVVVSDSTFLDKVLRVAQVGEILSIHRRVGDALSAATSA